MAQNQLAYEHPQNGKLLACTQIQLKRKKENKGRRKIKRITVQINRKFHKSNPITIIASSKIGSFKDVLESSSCLISGIYTSIANESPIKKAIYSIRIFSTMKKTEKSGK